MYFFRLTLHAHCQLNISDIKCDANKFQWQLQRAHIAYILKYIHSGKQYLTCVIAIYSMRPLSSLFHYKSFIQ